MYLQERPSLSFSQYLTFEHLLHLEHVAILWGLADLLLMLDALVLFHPELHLHRAFEVLILEIHLFLMACCHRLKEVLSPKFTDATPRNTMILHIRGVRIEVVGL